MKQDRLSHSQTAVRFKIGRASLTRWLRSIEPAPHPMRKRGFVIEQKYEEEHEYKATEHHVEEAGMA